VAEPPAGYVRIEGTSRVPVPGAVRVGPSDPNERLSVSIVLRRRPGAPPLPDLSQTGAPVGGHLSREEFAAVYGAAPDDIAQITQFASAHGLSVAETSIARRTVVLAGTVAQMEGAFGVDLGRYEVGEASYRGREGHVHMPAELASLVTGVFGLDNRQQARPALSLATASDQAAQAVSPLTPQQVAQLYNFPAGSAAGQCIGLIEFGGGYYDTDVTAWFASQNLPAPALTVVSVNGATNSPSGNAYSPDGEVILDIDVAGSAAPGAAIAVYFAPWTEDGWVNAVSTAVQDRINKPSVISTSWGYAEGEPEDGLTWTAAAMQHVSTTFAEAAVLGVTVLVASGDAGSDCRIGDGKAHVLYPASDPGVTACGGTTIQDVNAQSFTEALWSNPLSVRLG
jgi:kumamolisin